MHALQVLTLSENEEIFRFFPKYYPKISHKVKFQKSFKTSCALLNCQYLVNNWLKPMMVIASFAAAAIARQHEISLLYAKLFLKTLEKNIEKPPNAPRDLKGNWEFSWVFCEPSVWWTWRSTWKFWVSLQKTILKQRQKKKAEVTSCTTRHFN